MFGVLECYHGNYWPAQLHTRISITRMLYMVLPTTYWSYRYQKRVQKDGRNWWQVSMNSRMKTDILNGQMLGSIELHDFAYYSIGCWEQDPHKRPSFKEILQELDVIAQSGFGETPNESFHTMQDGWKKEINEVLRELRNKEKVKHIEEYLYEFGRWKDIERMRSMHWSIDRSTFEDTYIQILYLEGNDVFS